MEDFLIDFAECVFLGVLIVPVVVLLILLLPGGMWQWSLSPRKGSRDAQFPATDR